MFLLHSLLLAAFLATPFPSLVPEAVSVTQITVDGTPLSISPDGAWLAGTDATGAGFCVWDIGTLEPSCDGDLPAPVEVRSIAWSPDSSAAAFGLGASNRLVDSDIYRFDTVTGTLNNLTDDDPDGTGADTISAFAEPDHPVPVDRFPAWSPDGQRIVFSRTIWGDPNASGVSLMTISRDGGEPEEIGTIEAPAAPPIIGRVAWREDDSILLNVRHPDPQEEMNGLWTLPPEGDPVQILEGRSRSEIPQPVIADIAPDGHSASVYSQEKRFESLGRVQTGIYFHVDIDTGSVTPWERYPGVSVPAGTVIFAPPAFGPDGESVAFLVLNRAGGMEVWILDADGMFRTVAPIEYGEGRRPATSSGALDPAISWAADGTLLVVLVTGATLISPPDATATPFARPTG